MSLLTALGGLPPEAAIACATGNTARVYGLDVGVVADALGALAAGDLPGISRVLIDGKPVIGRSRNTPPAARAAEVVKGHRPAGSGH